MLAKLKQTTVVFFYKQFVCTTPLVFSTMPIRQFELIEMERFAL